MPTLTTAQGPYDCADFAPTQALSSTPTHAPTSTPTVTPAQGPTTAPTFTQTQAPGSKPTSVPTVAPMTLHPTSNPTSRQRQPDFCADGAGNGDFDFPDAPSTVGRHSKVATGALYVLLHWLPAGQLSALPSRGQSIHPKGPTAGLAASAVSNDGASNVHLTACAFIDKGAIADVVDRLGLTSDVA